MIFQSLWRGEQSNNTSQLYFCLIESVTTDHITPSDNLVARGSRLNWLFLCHIEQNIAFSA